MENRNGRNNSTNTKNVPRAGNAKSANHGRGAGSNVVISNTKKDKALARVNGNEKMHPVRRPSQIKEERARRAQMQNEEWNLGVLRTNNSCDRVFLALVLVILCLGTVMVFSASYPSALYQKSDGLYYIKRQSVFALAGIVIMLVVSRIPYRVYSAFAIPAYAIVTLLLIAVLIMGYSEGEAKRWLGIPNTSFSFQPSELLKPSLVLVLAWYFEKYKKQIASCYDKKSYFMRKMLFPILFIGLGAGLVILEKHLSGTAIIVLISVCVLFIAGAHYTILGIIVPSALGAVGFLLLNPYARQRLSTFTSEASDILGDKWQTTQGLYAIGSGGLFGVGLGESRQKYSYVSMAQNDFIFSIWCEEMGFIGAVVLIALFIALVKRGFKIAANAPDTFSALTVYGIVSQIGIQVLLNIAVVTDLFPNTGVSLPFFSYGGTSLVILMAEMGIVLSISRHSWRKAIL